MVLYLLQFVWIRICLASVSWSLYNPTVMNCPFVTGSPLFLLSVFGWWLPLPRLLRLPESVRGLLCSGPTVILLLMMAVLQSQYSQAARCLEETAIRQQLSPRSAILHVVETGLLQIMALWLFLLKTLHTSLHSPLFSEWSMICIEDPSWEYSDVLESSSCVLYISSVKWERPHPHTFVLVSLGSLNLNCFHRLLFSCHHYPT